MSTITARYIDTCLSGYLADGCNRPGQALCLTSLGCTLDESVDALHDSIDWDSGLPESIFDTDIKDAFRTALQGVDLRYIDEHGIRQTDSSDDDDRDEPVYIYVVLEWDAPRRQIDYRDLISSIDGYHGSQMKDRNEQSIQDEIATLKWIIEGE